MIRALLLLVGFTAAGCGTREGGGTTAPGGELARGDDESVIATVDGRPIRAAQVQLQARETGASPREALNALIDAEVAAGEAARRGLAADPSVREAVDGELVRRFLAATFEKEVTPAAVTDEDLRRAFHKNAGNYDHPELVHVRQILAATTPSDDAARRSALRARLADVAAAARGVPTPEAFSALAKRFSDAKITLVAQEGATDRDTMTVPAFAHAAFALGAPGDVSGVIETNYGFHVAYLVERMAERHTTFEQASAELRSGLWPLVRKREFARWVDQLIDKHKVAVAAQLLEEPAH